jgi:hypothetical protein
MSILGFRFELGPECPAATDRGGSIHLLLAREAR